MSTPEAQVVVAAQSLTKVFKDFWMRSKARAVDNVSFTINRGEIFGLLGPNGSGKSTTIKILLGLLRPTSGRVLVFGRAPSDVATKKRIGYLPEESYLYPFLNARETLDYYGKLFQLDRRVRLRRIDELLDMVGLTAVQFRAVREYSKGMQRRIGIAQALINDPEFLILDEPTTGLDPIGTRQIKDLILELGRRGKSILLSSHVLADVEDCVNRMVILYGGAVQREGTCDALLSAGSGNVIRTDDLDEETIRSIDVLIRERTQGRSGIGRVSRPRQTLEELFVDIVRDAQAKRLATSGAQHGGATAAFLREGDDTTDPDALLKRLTRDEPTAPVGAPAIATRAEEKRDMGPDASVIGGLLADAATSAAPPPASSSPSRAGGSVPPSPSGTGAGGGSRQSPAGSNVDQGLISSLLGDDAGGGGAGGKTSDGKPGGGGDAPGGRKA